MCVDKAKLSLVHAGAWCRCPEPSRGSSPSAGGALCDVCQEKLILSHLSLRAELHDDWLTTFFFNFFFILGNLFFYGKGMPRQHRCILSD